MEHTKVIAYLIKIFVVYLFYLNSFWFLSRFTTKWTLFFIQWINCTVWIQFSTQCLDVFASTLTTSFWKAFILMFVYIFTTANDEQLGYNYGLEPNVTHFIAPPTRIANLTQFCLDRQRTHRQGSAKKSFSFLFREKQVKTNFKKKKFLPSPVFRESKLSLIAEIGATKIGFCLIPKAASTTISLIMLSGTGFIERIENATNEDLRAGDQRITKSCRWQGDWHFLSKTLII